MPKVYIAGPMRGLPQLNFPAFDRAAALGRSLGWTVISPAEIDRSHGDTPEAVGPIQANGGEPEFVRKFVRRDADVLIDTLKAEEGDAIAILPGWGQSSGAMGEVALGKWLKLAILDATNFRPLNVMLLGYAMGEGLTGPMPPVPDDVVCNLDGLFNPDGSLYSPESYAAYRRSRVPAEFQACYNPRPHCDPECGCGPSDRTLLIREVADHIANDPDFDHAP